VAAARVEPVAREDRQSEPAAAYTHDYKKIEQVVGADQQCHCGHKFRVATAKYTPPEQNEGGGEHRCARYQGVRGADQVSREYQPRQPEDSDSSSKRIGDASRAYVAIGDGEEDAD